MNLKLSLAGAALAAGVLFATMPAMAANMGSFGALNEVGAAQPSPCRRQGAGAADAGGASAAGTNTSKASVACSARTTSANAGQCRWF